MAHRAGWFRAIQIVLAVACWTAPGAAADDVAQIDKIAASPETVRMLFRSVDGFGVAQGATLPISVVHAASFEEFTGSFGLASNTFGTVFGEAGGASPSQAGARLLPDVPINDWSDDFVDGVAPTALDGVRVLVNGRESFISFIGRAEDLGTGLDQINFVAPDDDALGPVSIEVFQGNQMVAASIVSRGVAAPALFAFGARDQTTYLAAVSAGGAFIAPQGFFPSVETRPAVPGETILLFGSGFGSTAPPVPAGQIVTVRSDIPAEELTVTIGGMAATVQFAGLAPNLVGLYQFNVVVPQLPAGDHAVQISRAGVASAAAVSIPVASQ